MENKGCNLFYHLLNFHPLSLMRQHLHRNPLNLTRISFLSSQILFVLPMTKLSCLSIDKMEPWVHVICPAQNIPENVISWFFLHSEYSIFVFFSQLRFKYLLQVKVFCLWAPSIILLFKNVVAFERFPYFHSRDFNGIYFGNYDFLRIFDFFHSRNYDFWALSILPVKCHKHRGCQRRFQGEEGNFWAPFAFLTRKLIWWWNFDFDYDFEFDFDDDIDEYFFIMLLEGLSSENNAMFFSNNRKSPLRVRAVWQHEFRFSMGVQ